MVFAFVFTACNSTNKNTKFYEKLEKTDNATVTLQKQMSGLGDYELIMKTDGNKSYASKFMRDPAYFTETVDGTAYTYKKKGSI